MGHLETNLAAIEARAPGRASAIASAMPLATVVEASGVGEPTLVSDGVLLHSRDHPVREAKLWAGRQRDQLEVEQAETAVVLGFGLGYHVEALAAVWPGRLVVVEPDDRLLRTALAARDLRAVLARVELAPEPLASEAIDAWGRIGLLPHGPSLLRDAAGLRSAQERIAGRSAVGGLRLRILVVSPLAGGSHPMTGYCARALAGLGHAVTVLDLAPFARGMEAIASLTPRRAARGALEAGYVRFLGDGILAALDAAEPDLVLAMAQAPLTAPVLAEIGRRGVARAFWFVEDHRVLPYWREVISEYDWFFTIQQGEFLAEAQRLSNGRARYLPCAADPAVHRPLALDAGERAAWGAPVAFVGAGYRNRRIVFRSLLDLGLKIWGSDWGDGGLLASALQREGGRIATEDVVRIFSATDVNLNLHSSTWLDGVDPRGDFVNPRTFEIAAAGAFQLVDARALLPPLLVPGVEAVTFTDAAELRDLVAHWLARPGERAEIAAAGRARVLREHTYRDRMEALLGTVCAAEAQRFRARARDETVAGVGRLEAGSRLGDLCRRLPPTTPFTLDGMVREVLSGQGKLTDPEAILLFLHQFDELYVREHRA